MLQTSPDRYGEIKNRLCRYAENDPDISAVIAVGSSTRENTPADEYSDLDLIIVTADPGKWFSGEYPALLGEISISFIEPTLGGGKERRSIYDGDKDVDMIVLTPEQFETALKEGVAAWVMNRGYRFLYGPGRWQEQAERFVSPVVSKPGMTEEDFLNTVGDFFFHNIWAYKKLMRGELWSAKMCIDSYLKQRLLRIIEQYQLVQEPADVWHDGRFLDRWADPSVTEELKNCFARYDVRDCKKALLATHELFARLAKHVAEKRGFAYPREAEACAARFIGKDKLK
ncbi:MAG: aminoglycoside 6-adenylyltransferase [Ruminococcus sp.]|nr:aminoglycoside 6-adenylyltransferase [Ruminococcus sp.]